MHCRTLLYPIILISLDVNRGHLETFMQWTFPPDTRNAWTAFLVEPHFSVITGPQTKIQGSSHIYSSYKNLNQVNFGIQYDFCFISILTILRSILSKLKSPSATFKVHPLLDWISGEYQTDLTPSEDAEDMVTLPRR